MLLRFHRNCETVIVCDKGYRWITNCLTQKILVKIKEFKISVLDFEIILRLPEFGNFFFHLFLSFQK